MTRRNTKANTLMRLRPYSKLSDKKDNPLFVRSVGLGNKKLKTSFGGMNN